MAPMKRIGDPQELGDACAFLCSARAGYITGQNLCSTFPHFGQLEPRQPFAAPAVEQSPMTSPWMGMWITR